MSPGKPESGSAPAGRTTKLPEDMGYGVSWGELDNDGWDDLFIENFSANIDMAVAKAGKVFYSPLENSVFYPFIQDPGQLGLSSVEEKMGEKYSLLEKFLEELNQE